MGKFIFACVISLHFPSLPFLFTFENASRLAASRLNFQKMDILLSRGVITGVLLSGISLVTTDLWFDLRYVLAHPKTMPLRRRQALEYYVWLLQPKRVVLLPPNGFGSSFGSDYFPIVPFYYPGWIFTAACSIYLLVCFPSMNHGAMALFYFPICLRYREMLRGGAIDGGDGAHDALRDWHWIVAIRFVLLALGVASLRVHS